MKLIVPHKWIENKKSQTIKIQGNAARQNTWVIVYQANDAFNHFKNSLKYDNWAEITVKKDATELNLVFNLPKNLAGKSITLNIGSKERNILLVNSDEKAEGSITLPQNVLGKPIYLNDDLGELLYAESFGTVKKELKLIPKSILTTYTEKINENSFVIRTERKYSPKTVSSIINLSNSNLRSGKILLMNSSHQDIAWMDSPEKCIVERDTMLLCPLFKMAEKDPTYRFDVEDALMIKEFIERHPDKKGLVQKMFNNGNISCGSTYIQPYEEMYSGEALVRQFYLGTKWLKDNFNYNANVYWNVDVPGRTLQMPQILKKAGTDYLMISRFEHGIFDWYSPDGSFVTAFSPGHYSYAFPNLQKSFFESAQFIAENSITYSKYFSSNPINPVIPLLSDWDMSPAKNYSSHISKWGKIKELQNENGEYISVNLPEIETALAPNFFKLLKKEAINISKIKGERPAEWIYIHGPSHQKALKASRRGDILLTVAEKFATINALTSNSFIKYPQSELTDAWENKIYPDHGWGGKHGDITDNLFLQVLLNAKEKAEKIVELQLNEIASKIDYNETKGIPVIVFNSLNWKRSSLTSFKLNIKEKNIKSIKLFSSNGEEVKAQLINKKLDKNGNLKSALVNFLASDIPSIGYKTFYITLIAKEADKYELSSSKSYENEYYKIKFGNGGIDSIYDKELQTELLDVSKFKGGEVFLLHSEGNGAGEFSEIQQPDTSDYDKLSNYDNRWQLLEHGEVFTSYKLRQQIKYAVVELIVKIYNNKKQIDYEIGLLNWEGVLYKEYRMAMPLNMNSGKVTYEVPFGKVTVGEDELSGSAGERYHKKCKDIHPRGIENWIGASNNKFGVTLSSSVVAADWVDPTDLENKQIIVQPILLASRKSCHWEGNDYLQTGNHRFKFSLTSHKSGWENGYKFGREANEELFTVLAPQKFVSASLDEEKSFYSTDKENIVITTIKKSEDDNNVIIRFYDAEGKDCEMDFGSFKSFKKAFLTNIIEEEQKQIKSSENTVKLKVGQNSIETIKLIY